MKYYKIKAKNFYDESHTFLIEARCEESSYIIQETRNEFTIWKDEFGEFECGEQPIYAELDDCKSLDEVHLILLAGDLIPKDAKFVDIEE